ncbi:septal ring lytic transglycosylase RlpA family protein [Microcoleus sp. FACHB-1515]|uniref:septal ring lytic transglycosylase RlpA family protein n=1 Tax=Cyanophyceae TaxID=3028117 RepID=UPI0028C46F29|nr:septal ring lytic transglycosylase RlpA family protein [Microcoleus sp. FACHB-1515]
MKTFPPVRSLQASITKPVRSLQSIAALTRRTPQAATKIRPALAIVPNSVIPLAVSLWQRQPDRISAPIAPPNLTSVQRATRFQTGEDADDCLQSSQKQPSKGKIFQVCLRDRVVAEFSNPAQADAMANRLRQWLKADRSADRLQLQFVNDMPAILVDDTVLVSIDPRLSKALRRNRELIAIDWLNQLRLALNAEPLSLVEAQMQLYGLSDQSKGELSGIASWYGPYFHGRLTAAGEIFNQNELTAAHPSLPFNTFLKVTNLETGKSVIVRINDRGPYVGTRSLDLSRQAARSIGSELRGVVNYEAVILDAPAIAQDRPSPDAVALSNTK